MSIPGGDAPNDGNGVQAPAMSGVINEPSISEEVTGKPSPSQGQSIGEYMAGLYRHGSSEIQDEDASSTIDHGETRESTASEVGREDMIVDESIRHPSQGQNDAQSEQSGMKGAFNSVDDGDILESAAPDASFEGQAAEAEGGSSRKRERASTPEVAPGDSARVDTSEIFDSNDVPGSPMPVNPGEEVAGHQAGDSFDTSGMLSPDSGKEANDEADIRPHLLALWGPGFDEFNASRTLFDQWLCSHDLFTHSEKLRQFSFREMIVMDTQSFEERDFGKTAACAILAGLFWRLKMKWKPELEPPPGSEPLPESTLVPTTAGFQAPGAVTSLPWPAPTIPCVTASAASAEATGTNPSSSKPNNNTEKKAKGGKAKANDTTAQDSACFPSTSKTEDILLAGVVFAAYADLTKPLEERLQALNQLDFKGTNLDTVVQYVGQINDKWQICRDAQKALDQFTEEVTRSAEATGAGPLSSKSNNKKKKKKGKGKAKAIDTTAQGSASVALASAHKVISTHKVIIQALQKLESKGLETQVQLPVKTALMKICDQATDRTEQKIAEIQHRRQALCRQEKELAEGQTARKSLAQSLSRLDQGAIALPKTVMDGRNQHDADKISQLDATFMKEGGKDDNLRTFDGSAQASSAFASTSGSKRSDSAAFVDTNDNKATSPSIPENKDTSEKAEQAQGKPAPQTSLVTPTEEAKNGVVVPTEETTANAPVLETVTIAEKIEQAPEKSASETGVADLTQEIKASAPVLETLMTVELMELADAQTDLSDPRNTTQAKNNDHKEKRKRRPAKALAAEEARALVAEDAKKQEKARPKAKNREVGRWLGQSVNTTSTAATPVQGPMSGAFAPTPSLAGPGDTDETSQSQIKVQHPTPATAPSASSNMQESSDKDKNLAESHWTEVERRRGVDTSKPAMPESKVGKVVYSTSVLWDSPPIRPLAINPQNDRGHTSSIAQGDQHINSPIRATVKGRSTDTGTSSSQGDKATKPSSHNAAKGPGKPGNRPLSNAQGDKAINPSPYAAAKPKQGDKAINPSPRATAKPKQGDKAINPSPHAAAKPKQGDKAINPSPYAAAKRKPDHKPAASGRGEKFINKPTSATVKSKSVEKSSFGPQGGGPSEIGPIPSAKDAPNETQTSGDGDNGPSKPAPLPSAKDMPEEKRVSGAEGDAGSSASATLPSAKDNLDDTQPSRAGGDEPSQPVLLPAARSRPVDKGPCAPQIDSLSEFPALPSPKGKAVDRTPVAQDVKSKETGPLGTANSSGIQTQEPKESTTSAEDKDASAHSQPVGAPDQPDAIHTPHGIENRQTAEDHAGIPTHTAQESTVYAGDMDAAKQSTPVAALSQVDDHETRPNKEERHINEDTNSACKHGQVIERPRSFSEGASVAKTERPRSNSEGASVAKTERPRPCSEGASVAKTESPRSSSEGASVAKTTTTTLGEGTQLDDRHTADSDNHGVPGEVDERDPTSESAATQPGGHQNLNTFAPILCQPLQPRDLTQDWGNRAVPPLQDMERLPYGRHAPGQSAFQNHPAHWNNNSGYPPRAELPPGQPALQNAPNSGYYGNHNPGYYPQAGFPSGQPALQNPPSHRDYNSGYYANHDPGYYPQAGFPSNQPAFRNAPSHRDYNSGYYANHDPGYYPQAGFHYGQPALQNGPIHRSHNPDYYSPLDGFPHGQPSFNNSGPRQSTSYPPDGGDPAGQLDQTGSASWGRNSDFPTGQPQIDPVGVQESPSQPVAMPHLLVEAAVNVEDTGPAEAPAVARGLDVSETPVVTDTPAGAETSTTDSTLPAVVGDSQLGDGQATRASKDQGVRDPTLVAQGEMPSIH